MCRLLGVALRKIEADERRPSRQIAERLAECLKIAPDERATFLQVARGERRVDRLREASLTATADYLPIRLTSNLPLPPVDRPFYESDIAAARAQLDEAAFETAWAEGRVTPLEAVVEDVLSA